MNRILELWDILEKENSPQSGYISRRFSKSIDSNVFIAIKKPENWYSIFWLFDSLSPINPLDFRTLAEIQVSHELNLENSNKQMLVFSLKNDSHREIFATLIADLIQNVGMEKKENLVFNSIVNRFEKWRTLFSKIYLGGMSKEQQLGLYGELSFLREVLNQIDNFGYIIRSWRGPEKNEVDFQIGDWGVEVKTTKSKMHQKIHISNENQLDDKDLSNLFLYFLSVNELINSGENLNTIIREIEEILSRDESCLTSFRSKIYEAGYFQTDFALYEDIGYKIRDIKIFRVFNGFPRIISGDLMPGIGDVKYSILADNLESFRIDLAELMNGIKAGSIL